MRSAWKASWFHPKSPSQKEMQAAFRSGTQDVYPSGETGVSFFLQPRHNMKYNGEK
jgi:hypothetical protein